MFFKIILLVFGTNKKIKANDVKYILRKINLTFYQMNKKLEKDFSNLTVVEANCKRLSGNIVFSLFSF